MRTCTFLLAAAMALAPYAAQAKATGNLAVPIPQPRPIPSPTQLTPAEAQAAIAQFGAMLIGMVGSSVLIILPIFFGQAPPLKPFLSLYEKPKPAD